MLSQAESAGAGSHANAIDIRVGAEPPIYRVVSWAPTSIALEALAIHGRRGWPEKVGATVSISTVCRVLCIGPSEWLAIGGESGPPIPEPFAVVELFDAFANIELLGTAVEELLTSLCGLDVCPSAFPPDTCARTRLAGVAVVLDRCGAEEFACYVSRSYLNYLLAALHECARGVMHVSSHRSEEGVHAKTESSDSMNPSEAIS